MCGTAAECRNFLLRCRKPVVEKMFTAEETVSFLLINKVHVVRFLVNAYLIK